MHGCRWLRLCLLVLSVCAALATAAVAAPWAGLLSKGSVDADPNKPYTLTEENGPWMIMACSFSGDGAEDQAHELVVELRKRYKLEAYVHKIRFDMSDIQGRGVDRFGRKVRMRPAKGTQLQEYAVLVGNYQSVDDPEAQKVLSRLKATKPKTLQQGEETRSKQSLAGWRALQKQVHEIINDDQKDAGPMRHAFVTVNPTLPKEYFNPKGIDSFVLKLNDGVPYSLLDCKGKYTVQVATFNGEVLIKPKDIKDVEDGRREWGTQLSGAAAAAALLTQALRIKGYEAYQFHDRCASIVTVGSFERIGTPLADGKIDLDPRIVSIMRTFGPNEKTKQPQHVLDIVLDVQPLPVEVPKRTVSAGLARGPLSQR